MGRAKKARTRTTQSTVNPADLGDDICLARHRQALHASRLLLRCYSDMSFQEIRAIRRATELAGVARQQSEWAETKFAFEKLSDLASVFDREQYDKLVSELTTLGTST